MANEAPDPQNIVWENIYTGGFKKKVRKLFSFLVFLLLLIGCKFILLIFYSLCNNYIYKK